MSSNFNPLFLTVEAPEKQRRLGSMATSYLVQGVAVAALLAYTIAAPVIAPSQTSHVELMAPPVTEPEPAQEPVQTAKVRPMPAPSPMAPELPATPPKIETPVLQVQQPQRVRRNMEIAEVAQPQLPVIAPKFDSKVLNSLPGPKTMPKVIATNTFGSSATPTLQNTPASKVQTGGFGDPNGVPANARGSNRSTLAAAGSFDLPTGAGHGNGSGGANGARGTVASAGFGNGVAVQGGHAATQNRIQNTSFASNQMAESPRVRAAEKPTASPVQIQSKPTPLYTSEARQLKVEGEVLLNVVFTADGRIRVLNVVRGLGHGLDEAARRAAEGVRFSPAMRDGHPVDSNATLHIVFQLS